MTGKFENREILATLGMTREISCQHDGRTVMVTMIREKALKIILVIVGLAFTAATYPVAMILWQRERSGYTDAMMGSIYITLGVFLLMAVRKPADHRSLIAFAGWSSVAHASVMAIMALSGPGAREHLLGTAIFVIVGIPLLVLAPAKPSGARAAVTTT